VHARGVPFLRQVLRALGVAEHDIDDVLQEVLIAAYRSLDRYDESRYNRPHPELDSDHPVLLGAPLAPFSARRAWSPLFNWLFGIAWRQVSHHRERAYRRREIPMGLHDSAIFAAVDQRPTLEQHIASAERARIVGTLLAIMDPQRRVILVMHDMLDIQVADIARELQINENTAQNRLRLARQDFRAAARRLPAESRSALRLGERPLASEESTPRRPARPRRS
jgi:RNA polymerase sigma-70 factor, ECF subfamily